jgi:putative transposase
MEYRKTSHAVYDLKYHVVWITKYRKKVLRGQIALRLRELIRQTCSSLDVYIESGHVAIDHVHLLVSVPPQLAVSDLMQRLKGRSSRRMLEEFGELRQQFWGQHLWARGYILSRRVKNLPLIVIPTLA